MVAYDPETKTHTIHEKMRTGYGYLITTRVEDNFGRTHETHEWAGPIVGLINRRHLGWSGLTPGGRRYIGKHRVILVAEEFAANAWLVVLMDHWPVSHIVARVLPLLLWLSWVSQTLYATLQLWGLAPYRHGERGRWSDLDVIQSISRTAIAAHSRFVFARLIALLRMAVQRKTSH